MSKKGENIYKRKDGRWEARYIKSRDEVGRIKYGYCYGKTYREAKAKAETLKADLLSGKACRSKKKKSISQYCYEWLRLKRSKVKESTYIKYKTNIENHIVPFFGGCFLRSVSPLLTEEFGHSLLFENGFSPKTVKAVLSQLKSILEYASKQENIAVPEVVFPREPPREMRVLSKSEEDALIKYLLKDMDGCKFGTLLALLTGMRIGEVCALRWGDISFENMTVKVSSTMQRIQNTEARPDGKKTRVIINDAKSVRSARLIPLTGFALEQCRKMRVDCPKAFVLTGSETRFVEPRTLQYRFKKYANECNLTQVHFHVLRHTFATRCVEVGFEIKSLSEVLGHASPKITLERYVHSSLELKRDNMKKLEKLGY